MGHKTIVAQADIATRIEQLAVLEPGWLDGKGVVPSRGSWRWLAGAFDRHYPADAPRPYLFPTPEGLVLVEWSMKPCSPSLEIDFASRQGQWHALNLETDVENGRQLDLNDPATWAWLATELQRLAGVTG